MVKIKPIIFSAGAAFVFSFFTALFAKSGFPIALLKAVIFAAVFGGIAVGVQFVFGIFLSDGGGSAPQEVSEERQRVGGKVDLVVSEEDLPDDKEAPAFFVDGRRVVTDEDVASNAAKAAAAESSMKSLDGGSDGAISAREQNQALEAAEGVRAQKAAENIEKKAREVSEAKAASPAESSAGEAKPAFAPIDLAAKGQAAEVSEEAVPTVVAEEREAPKAPAKPSDPELDELPDISGFGNIGGGAAAPERGEDDGVIEDSEFAQDGSVKIHRQTEFADGKVADVKDAPVMAEAIRTILKSEE